MAGIRDAFSKGITTINVKTDNFMELTKCKTHINTLKSECSALYTRIGETVYQQWKSSGVSVGSIEPLLQEVKQKMDDIDKEFLKIENLQKIEQEILGKKNSGPQPQYDENRIFCPQCGCANSPEYKFCCSCGTPLMK